MKKPTSPAIKPDELPDRIAHRRKIAIRIALDQPQFAADDPSRAADCPDGASGYRVTGPAGSGFNRGPHV